MNEHLEEIIKIAWKANSVETEYYLQKHLSKINREIFLIKGEIIVINNLFDPTERELLEQNNLRKELEALEKELNRLSFLISSLRGT